MLDITEIDPQLYNAYLEQQTAQMARDFYEKHMNYVDSEEKIIRREENYLGDVDKTAWEAQKKKFPEELTTLVM